MRDIRTSGSARGERVAYQGRPLSSSTVQKRLNAETQRRELSMP
jgi:hypothetical protein